MQILELQLFSTDIDAQEKVFGHRLGFSVDKSEKALVVHCGENRLVFQKSNKQYYYHYCFLVPTGSLESAITFLDDRRFEAISFQEKRIVQFENGRSVYFYDGDGNIAEFIERPITNYPLKNTFEIADVIKLNEIGLPVSSPLDTSEELISQYGIVPLSRQNFSKDFCWVGDHHGVILVTKEGRNWLPTQKPSEINDFAIHFNESGNETHLRFENNRITKILK